MAQPKKRPRTADEIEDLAKKLGTMALEIGRIAADMRRAEPPMVMFPCMIDTWTNTRMTDLRKFVEGLKGDFNQELIVQNLTLPDPEGKSAASAKGVARKRKKRQDATQANKGVRA